MHWPTPISTLLQQPGDGRPVAFDADGTLWRGDVGEELLRHLGHEGLLPAWQGRGGVYAEYERRLAHEPADAYAFAAAVMAGLDDRALSERCRAFFAQRFSGRVFGFVRPLLQALTAGGYSVWVVSASPRWPVQAGAQALGLEPRQVIGVDVELDEAGALTSRVVAPVPCGQGKVLALQARSLRPALAVGNGELDLQMLCFAERAVVVAPHAEAPNGLVQTAIRERWPVIRA